jgi:aminoglycoside phosphotransferase (APT) family kinase protein
VDNDGDVTHLEHGYTNLTRRLTGGVVEKRYEGSDRFDRADREYACLVRLAPRLPVPEVIERAPEVPLLIMREAHGAHGQDMIDSGRASEVVQLLGAALLQLQSLPTSAVPGLAGAGTVIVHGDYGPQNVLIRAGEVSALVDWESAHVGQPVEDLAWAEWIVRMHHPRAVTTLPKLHDAARLSIEWSTRHQAMTQRCVELMRYCEAAGSADAAELWRHRLEVTERWTE